VALLKLPFYQLYPAHYPVILPIISIIVKYIISNLYSWFFLDFCGKILILNSKTLGDIASTNYTTFHVGRLDMVPLVTIFLDGLRPESLKYMPFLASLPYQNRMKTLLGYSVACHASMYTGVFPDRHLLWFIWKYAPDTSPHRWLQFLPFPILFNHLPAKYFLTKTARLFSRPSGFFGLPYIVHLPVKYWKFIDVAEKKFWLQPNYLDTYPSMFDLLRENNVDFDVVGMICGAAKTADAVANYQFSVLKPWTYLFFGDVDGLSHRFTQDSPETTSELKRFDQIIERIVTRLQKESNDLVIIAFSDHGHIEIERKVDVYRHFKEYGDNLNHYLHIIDANYLRIWFSTHHQEKHIREILSNLPGGYILEQHHLRKYHVLMPDNRYGDLIYYLDAPLIFSKTIWGWSRSINSMHGYSPDHERMDGFIASNRPFDMSKPCQLVDILPSHLSAMNISIPQGLDGRVIWT
jgi:predicted AlkP superfamily pyrophosphatase or phosphodiesterase